MLNWKILEHSLHLTAHINPLQIYSGRRLPKALPGARQRLRCQEKSPHQPQRGLQGRPQKDLQQGKITNDVRKKFDQNHATFTKYALEVLETL